ncbi:MAG: hypothetical protein KDD22_07300 [Bdellovibrionales bacterium]|nr:hypothetical protein [Bdellovibrionales bacterium]
MLQMMLVLICGTTFALATTKLTAKVKNGSHKVGEFTNVEIVNEGSNPVSVIPSCFSIFRPSDQTHWDKPQDCDGEHVRVAPGASKNVSVMIPKYQELTQGTYAFKVAYFDENKKERHVDAYSTQFKIEVE